MSDEGKDKKTPKRTFRINYERCGISGGRKKEQDMNTKNLCNDCYEKKELATFKIKNKSK